MKERRLVVVWVGHCKEARTRRGTRKLFRVGGVGVSTSLTLMVVSSVYNYVKTYKLRTSGIYSLLCVNYISTELFKNIKGAGHSGPHLSFQWLRRLKQED